MKREFIPLVREGGFRNAEKFYILSYEGALSEKKYFEDLRVSEFFNNSGKIEVIALRKTKKEGTAPTYVKARLNEAKKHFRFKNTDEFWLIIDKDHWEDNQHIDIRALYDSCAKEKNFFVALSNPCFEMWLVLHLVKLSEISEKDRIKLLENPKVSDKKNFIDVFLATLMDKTRNDGKQRGYNKRPNPKLFLPRIHEAISNARDIPEKEGSYLETLGTHVYKLVEKLVKPVVNTVSVSEAQEDMGEPMISF